MKVIDIMHKVANKEIFKFRIDDVNYYVDKSNYICEEDGTKVEWYIDDEWLNMNAEIIEEDKKIERITNKAFLNSPFGELVGGKFNEIIDAINEMRKDK